MKILLSTLLLIITILLAGCSSGAGTETEAASDGATQVSVMTHDSFAISQELIDQFTAETGIEVTFVPSGDTGAAINRAILSKGSPIAGVFYGIDNAFLSRALSEELFVEYNSPLLEQIPDEFELDPTHHALPVDYGDVCINYDKVYFNTNNLPIPDSLDDLADPIYNGLLVVENPAVSSPGLSFLLATIVHFGEDGFQAYWQSLRDNGVVVVNDWNTAYYTNFTAAGQGQQPLVVSYASSPVAEVVFAEQPPDEAPTGSIVGTDTCFRQVEFVGILNGTQNLTAAQQFVDFMLGKEFQEDIPLQMFVFPVNETAELPEAFRLHAQVPDQPARMDPTLIAENRERWIQTWSEIMLP